MMSRAIILSLTVYLSGCSYLFMDRVSSDYKPGQELKCSDGSLPTVDLVAAILGVVSAATLNVQLHSTWDCELFDKCTSVALVISVPFLIATTLYAVSSWYGYCWAEECDNTRKRFGATPHSGAAKDAVGKQTGTR